MRTIVDSISHFSAAANRLESQLKSMEAKYEEELRNEERKTELQKSYTEIKREQEKLSGQIAPLNQRIDAKNNQKRKARKLAEEEEARFSDTLSSFNNDRSSLNQVIASIEEYLNSNSQEEVEAIEDETKKLNEKSKAKKAELVKITPEHQRLTAIVDDQEQQKKNLEENITLARSRKKKEQFRMEIINIESELSQHENYSTLDADLKRLGDQFQGLIKNKARLEGRRAEMIDNQRALKRKLKAPEYRNVEDEFRIATIKMETTEMAVKDIEKYHSALDKALQRYHSLKITDINAIIRDLWTLTYKGEDITNIEIVSGKGTGTSTRSYNYRIMMSKGGSSKMEMRGRCSAGQRVLASIVIRLALAETFCVQFGCIALDEPTVNLDYNNKKGLAIALAQIIASRSQQSNFQLILITHDEDFVLMMKNELQTLTNVSMPEKYFQVRREEGADGKYYSKIDAIDWSELL